MARKWQKTVHNMSPNHTWRCTPGYQICVIGRGDLQFEFPQNWHAEPTDNSIKVTDKIPPHDNVVLEVSVLHYPAMVKEKPTLTLLMQEIMLKDGRFVGEEEIIRVPREDVEIIWMEYREIDPKEKREAVWRRAFCHYETYRHNLYGIVTYGFWPEDTTLRDIVWQNFVKTLIMGRYVEDPTLGPRLH